MTVGSILFFKRFLFSLPIYCSQSHSQKLTIMHMKNPGSVAKYAVGTGPSKIVTYILIMRREMLL